MKKIICLFERNFDGDLLVRDEVVQGAEWVVAGEGVATQKLDGTCCLVRDGKLYKRYQVRKGKKAPDGFEAASEVDPVTGKQFGWVPVGDGPEDRWHREAFAGITPVDGTYELCGPKIQGNPERLDSHILCLHGFQRRHDAPRTFDELKDFFQRVDMEGIVWHHQDGRMVKIKGSDFGIVREKT